MTRRATWFLAAIASVLFVCATASGQDLANRGIQKMHRPGEAYSPPDPEAVHLNYYGGPVVSNVEVVQVLWGPISDTVVTTNLPTFYTDIVNSPYMDWLCEYNTNVTSYMGTTTNQATGRGTFAGQIQIVPSVGAMPPATITDTQVSNELASQIGAAVLPAPSVDAQGNVNTVYMFHFPQGITVTLNGNASCTAFCAYHGTKLYNGLKVPYGVIPYQNGTCAGGCGMGTYLQNLEAVSSHELIESVNDTAIGLLGGMALGPPVAWYSTMGGEIGDICNGLQATIMVGANTHTVQKEWSNRVNACIAVASASLADCPCVSAAPHPVSGCLAGDATFDVSASGASLTYQWRRNTVDLVDGGRILGANSPTLMISGLVAGDAGSYDVRVGSLTCGSVVLTTSASALTVSADAADPDVTPPSDLDATQSVCQ